MVENARINGIISTPSINGGKSDYQKLCGAVRGSNSEKITPKEPSAAELEAIQKNFDYGKNRNFCKSQVILLLLRNLHYI